MDMFATQLNTKCEVFCSRACTPWGCFHDQVANRASLPISTNTVSSEDPAGNPGNKGQCHSSSTMVASAIMVYHSQGYGIRFYKAAASASPSYPECRQHPSPRPGITPPNGLEDSPLMREVLKGARKPCTKLLQYTLLNGTVF